jgi:hypothetical protein
MNQWSFTSILLLILHGMNFTALGFVLYNVGDRSGAVVKVLRYKSEGREGRSFDSRCVTGIFH